jgi:hypothetical protein
MSQENLSSVRVLFPAIACLLTAATAAAAPRVFPTGVTLYDPAKAWNSFVLFAAPDEKTHLIDMDGNEVHRWDYFGFPSELLDPQVTHGALGHILVQNQAIGGGDTSVTPGRPTGE